MDSPQQANTIRLGANLRKLREKAGLSMDELADKAGVGRTTVYRIEQGQMAPKLGTVYALAAVLGVEVRILLKASA